VTDEVLERLAGRRFICIDGPAGSGKSTLAASLGAPVVPMDDLCDGWTGLDAGIDAAQRLVDALMAGDAAGYRRYDWHAEAYDGWVPVEPAPLHVIEGCGSGSIKADALLVWIETSPAESLRRGLARDGEQFRDHWLRWQEQEAEVFARDRTRERAELLFRT
jgi:energy-coupling factor transporter ATP-binding protein EcfA2